MKSTIFSLMFVGITLLAGAGYVLGHLAFMNAAGMDNAFSIIWTVVITVLLYMSVRYSWKASSATTTAERRREAYGFVLALCEFASFATLIFLAILFSTVSTMPGNEHFLTMIITVGVSAIALLVVSRSVRIFSNRPLLATNS